MDLFVFNRNLERIGIIDDYINLKIERNYRKQSSLELTLGADENLISLLQKGNILTKENDTTLGYIIDTFEFTDEEGAEIYVKAPSMSSILERRIVLGQQEYYGTADYVMKQFVRFNAIETRNANRKIPGLVNSPTIGVGVDATIGTANENLSEVLFEVGNNYDLTHDIKMDVEARTLTFDVWQGADRSTQQLTNPHVIFSKEFDNVLAQNYVDSDSNYKSTAIIAGEDAVNRTTVTAYDSFAGLDRREVFIDANNIKKTYKNEEDVEVTLTTLQYLELLLQYGNGKLSSMKRIETFESSVDPTAQFEYGKDYFLGDRISIRNSVLNIALHTRITSVTEEYSGEGSNLSIDFGENVPTLLDKLKRSVR